MRKDKNTVLNISKTEITRMQKVYSENRRIGRDRLSREAGVSVGKARTFIAMIKNGKITCQKKPVVSTLGRSREEIKNSFDPVIKTRNAIRVGVSKLETPMMYSESDFKKELCGDFVPNFFKRVSEEEEFLPFQVWIPGTRIHWCTPQDVEWAEKNITGACRITTS